MSFDTTKIEKRLKFIYGEESQSIIAPLKNLIEKYYGKIAAPLSKGWSEKDVFLITYADSLVGDVPPLQVLNQFLKQEVGSVFTMVHLLPHFPFSSDDGFSVIDYREVRQDLGTWEDVKKLTENYRVCFDAVVNHVSAHSKYVQGFCSGNPEYENFFITLDPSTDVSKVFRPRNLPLLTPFETVRGKEWLWTTFSPDQVDWNYANPMVLLEMLDILLFYAQQGSSVLRIDAPTYIWKELGTNCIHRPQGHELMKLFRDVYDLVIPDMIILSETNVPHQENISYFGNGNDEAQMVYNFPLQSLALWTVAEEDAIPISRWAKTITKISERCTFLNFTASHDGIALLGAKGYLSENDIQKLCARAKAHGGDVSMRAHGDGNASPYELNINYFDAINDPNGDNPLELQVQKFLLTQAMACSLMGIPAIYIHSLLGSSNDYEGVKKTGRARSINREQLYEPEVLDQIHTKGNRRNLVLNSLKRLLQVRQSQSAFHPNCPHKILDFGKSIFAIQRIENNGPSLIALMNVSGQFQTVNLSPYSKARKFKDIWSNENLTGSEINLNPYQFCWLIPLK